MITDVAALADIRQSWEGARMLRPRVQRGLVGVVGAGAGTSVLLADIAHNLPFLHACSVLNDTLEQLRDEGVFRSKKRTLGALVAASTGSLVWLDRTAIDRMVIDRNALAHDGAVLARATCWQYIALIEQQLGAWSVV